MYVLQTPLNWEEIMERFKSEKIMLRSTAYIKVQKHEDHIVLLHHVDHEQDGQFTAGYRLMIKRSDDRNYPIQLGLSELQGCTIIALPTLVISFVLLLLASLVVYAVNSQINDLLIGLWSMFGFYFVLWLLMKLGSQSLPGQYHEIRRVIEPMLRGKFAKVPKQKKK